MSKKNILQLWEITPTELTKIIEENPSSKGLLIGYIAEYKFRKMWLENKKITDYGKADDHDRKQKGDRVIGYKKRKYAIEVKSLQSTLIKYDDQNSVWRGKTQVDASDRREIELPNGEIVNTTCLKIGEFDILAVNLFEFEQKWRFVFAKNSDLPRSKYKKYTEEQRSYLLATLIDVSWPPEPPFYSDLFDLLDDFER
jgi:hypothetical protein